MTTPLLDVDVQFVKYGQFHRNPINKAIHIVFVPILLFTAMVWASTIQGPLWRYSPIFPINGSLVVAVSYGVYYIALCPSIGALYLPLLLMMYRGSEIFATQAGWPIPPVIAATILHIISWVFQILGHALFEGRAPAFMKEPIQAFVLAPLFVFCEVLFDLGFFKKTHARLEIKVEAAVKKLDATSKSQ